MYECPKCSIIIVNIGGLYTHLMSDHDMKASDAYEMCSEAKITKRNIDENEKLIG